MTKLEAWRVKFGVAAADEPAVAAEISLFAPDVALAAKTTGPLMWCAATAGLFGPTGTMIPGLVDFTPPAIAPPW